MIQNLNDNYHLFTTIWGYWAALPPFLLRIHLIQHRVMGVTTH